MIRKEFLLFILIFSFNSFSNIFAVKILDIENWDNVKRFSTNKESFESLYRFSKNELSKEFIYQDLINDEEIFINVVNNSGYTKIYINNNFVGSIGNEKSVKNREVDLTKQLSVPTSLFLKDSYNSIKLINYTSKDFFDPKVSLHTDPFLPIPIKIFESLQYAKPLLFIAIIIISIFTYKIFRDLYEEEKYRFYIGSLTLFLIYFVISGLNFQLTKSTEISPLATPFFIGGWTLFILYFINKYSILKRDEIIKLLFRIFVIGMFLILLSNFSPLYSNRNSTYKFLVLGITILFYNLTNKAGLPELRKLKQTLVLCLFLQISDGILSIFFIMPDAGIEDLTVILMLIGHYLTLSQIVYNKFNENNKFSVKLEKSLNKVIAESQQKDEKISDLKIINEEILKEKALLLGSLGRNIRAPLNSIIGYGEALYSTPGSKKIAPIINEIIVESDKIFQTINNVMDFSIDDFSSSDLILRDFRIKEMYDNSVYSSDIIQDFKNNLIYKPVGFSDKILIQGNPFIYKQMLTGILEFLISLTPKNIEVIVNSKITSNDYMELYVKISGNDMNSRDKLEILPLKESKDIFSKYIKLYNIDFKEEFSDNNYLIEVVFQCKLSDKSNVNELKKEKESKDLLLDKQISVLVVDDYKPNVNIVELHLKKMGCDVYTATNGEEALSIFKEEYIDVILMDISMPIMDGWEATERIRSTDKGLNTVIIGLTASSLDLDIRHCFESGMDDVQVKPIRKNQLYNKLKNIDDYKPEQFPTLSSLRADYGTSKEETESLFVSTVLQIIKQLDVLDILLSAKDKKGIEREIPALLNAALIINAFYFSRIIRNFQDAFIKDDEDRIMKNYLNLVKIIIETKEANSDLFWDR